MTIYFNKTITYTLLALLLMLVGGCQSSQAKKDTITGVWTITATSSNQYSLSISHLNNNIYLITADDAQISGQYQFKDDTLTMIKSNIPSISKSKFNRLVNGNWKIIEAPPAFRIRVQLVGAIISRD